jgi:cobalamin biosynthetic protein CobC
MLIRSHIGMEPLAHGGDLAAARRMFPDAPEPFVDLSTGINPHSYPLPTFPPKIFARLPERTAVRHLAVIAAQAYGAPSPDHVRPAPGTQILLPLVAHLAEPGRAAVLSTTYAEHKRAAMLAGHSVDSIDNVGAASGSDLVIVVNPNNPDGSVVPRDALLPLAKQLARTGGLLVIDEAFGDVAPISTSLAGDVGRGNIVVLRSFGKFFGLAGLRLGFAIAAPSLIERLDAMLGPWAVSGPALHVGEKAMVDQAWKEQTLAHLTDAKTRLDGLLIRAGLEVIGGTSLFRLTRSPDAEQLFMRLGRAGILVRRFTEQPDWLRWGLPRSENDWQRLSDALN